jgi:hypothetical protein
MLGLDRLLGNLAQRDDRILVAVDLHILDTAKHQIP